MSSFPIRRLRAHSSCKAWRTPAFALALVLAPVAAQGQDASLPAARFRNLLEAQLLTGGLGEDVATPPSLRATLQRRISLDWSLLASALFLQDELSHSAGGALGLARTIPAGSFLVEPFVEAGAAWADARFPDGSYTIRTSGGGTETVTRYGVSQGVATVFGGGVSLFFITQNGIVVRPGLGYWRFFGGAGHGVPGRVRVSVGLGTGRRDEPWYELATDRTPPVVVAVGDEPAVGDSVPAGGGAIEIYASDANGIETVLVDREVMELEPAGGTPGAMGLHDGAVVARVEISPPFGGQVVQTVARDRAGVVTRREFRAFADPDVQAPMIEATDTTNHAFGYEAMADDFSGIAEASVDVCPAPVRHLASVGAELGGRSALARVIAGWGDFQDPVELVVTDRSGNVARAQVPIFAPVVDANAEAPVFDSVSATAVGTGGGWALVEGIATDPAGGWLAAVAVDGQPVVLSPDATPERVRFSAWVARGAEDRLTLTARTADGRVRTAAVEVERAEEPTRTGRLEVVLLGSAADQAEAVRDRLGAVEDLLGPARVSAYSGQGTIVPGLVRLRRRLAPGGSVWVHIEGLLSGAPNDPGPRVEFADRSSISVASLARLIRTLEADAVLVSSRILPGNTWQVPLRDVPGAQPAPGCFDQYGGPPGGIAAFPDVPLERILEALTGAGDRNGDGSITVAEVLYWARVAVPDGALPFRPDAPLTPGGNER